MGWESSYPSWWWQCDHGADDKECIYCWKKHTSQPFASQYSYYANTQQGATPYNAPGGALKQSPGTEGGQLPPLNHGYHSAAAYGGGGGSYYPGGASYTLPAPGSGVRSKHRSHPPARYVSSHPSNGGQANCYQGNLRHHSLMTLHLGVSSE